MIYAARKSCLKKIINISFVALLTACSSDSSYKRQINGDKSYLNKMLLMELKVPEGMILPIQNGHYDIPISNKNGAVGKALDIRPPLQLLVMFPNVQTQLTDDKATLLIENGHSTMSLWSKVVNVIKLRSYTLNSRDEANQTLITDWIEWHRLDENQQYRGRYKISVEPKDHHQAVVVQLLNLEQAGKSVSDIASMRRYNAEMMNVISIGLSRQKAISMNEIQTHSKS